MFELSALFFSVLRNWNDAYHHIVEMSFVIGFQNFSLEMSLYHWIRDGLIALFFFVVGLELKREILVGELADPKQALLPIIAAIGGMFVPAFIYMIINPQGHAFDGWRMPMATDIAFALGEGVNLVQDPAQILEHKMHLPSAYLIIPIFYLANAGIPVDWTSFSDNITHPVSLGIMDGLVLGKLIGVAGLTWIAVKFGLSKLLKRLNFNHIVGAGLMAGIGFTMAIFIAELGFAHHKEDLLLAKNGILLASFIAGISGFIWLFFTCSPASKSE